MNYPETPEEKLDFLLEEGKHYCKEPWEESMEALEYYPNEGRGSTRVGIYRCKICGKMQRVSSTPHGGFDMISREEPSEEVLRRCGGHGPNLPELCRAELISAMNYALENGWQNKDRLEIERRWPLSMS